MASPEIDLIKRENPLERVMAEHGVKLQRRGGRFVARCPFHEEQHPSLVVYPDTRSFYCFGCRASGDVIDFVRRMEKVDFKEAVRRLGGNGGDEHSPLPPPSRLTVDDQLILAAAANVYHETLLQTDRALRYLESRGVGTAVARRCRLGFSDGHSLRPFLQRHRLSLRRAGQLGLLRRDGSEPMAGRIVIPELREGQCIWMVGRALDDRRLKYLGLSLPKPILGYERVRGQRRVFVTEGAFDYLTGVAWNLPICALLGTHVRVERLAFLQRAHQVVLAFDNDEPGRAAATELATTLGARASVLGLPEGVKDLSELAQRPDGRQAFFELLRQLAPRKEADHAPSH
ncbi:MAG: toprim domain-containing protein [Dehalococcoidia bacterium]|nr:toprim domain-containing protein [Dehalococcoidia bacterium]